jgi:glycosyltransferase involved in cell wall biosynthesis
MRLLLVTDAVGGVWAYSLELARALRPLGVETILAIVGPAPKPQQCSEAAKFKLIETRLPLEWVETTPDEQRRAGKAIAELAGHESVDVVQTCSASVIAHAAFDRPCVAVQHSCTATWWAAVRGTPLPPEFEWRRELVGRGLSRAAAVVAPSLAFAADTARTYNFPTGVQAVHNGRRADRPVGVPQGDFVLTASRLWDEGKNAATLDAAAARLTVIFEAAGPVDGPNGASARFEHLHVLGEISASRVAGLRAARPIFASAALYEPFGLSVLEAAQAGCALVLSDIPTHRELWDEVAVFVPARDDSAFASAIQRLLNDPDERRELGERARVCGRSYTPERMASQMAAIYARLVEAPAEPKPLQMAGAE